ncbi:MAG: NYN domain-containing protein [Candidatus Obscuribacterales bacterium]
MAKKKAYVYIDGFNLYYGSLKGTKLKWLDVEKMCELLLPQHDIEKIIYFTAQVSGTPTNPDAPQRQHKYVRALKTIKKLEIMQGHFIVDYPVLPLADGSGDVKVRRMKEKQSDANMATTIMWHAHCNCFETAVLVTGDSDFLSAVQYVRHYFKREVVILDPQRNGTPNSPLNKEANIYKPIRNGVLSASQFPAKMTDAKGEFYKPGDWC